MAFVVFESLVCIDRKHWRICTNGLKLPTSMNQYGSTDFNSHGARKTYHPIVAIE